MKKQLIIGLIFILSAVIVNAIDMDVVCTTSINISIANDGVDGKINLSSQGILKMYTFTNYSENIPLTLIKTVTINTVAENISLNCGRIADNCARVTDALNDTATFANKYSECGKQLSSLEGTVKNTNDRRSECETKQSEVDRQNRELQGYFTEYKICQTTMSRCNIDLNNTMNLLVEEEQGKTSWGVIWAIIGAVVCYGAIWYKKRPKTSLPPSSAPGAKDYL